MEAPLINLQTEVDHCLGVPNLCRTTIWSAVDSGIATFMCTLYEACCENMMSLHGNNGRNVDSAMASVQRLLGRFRGSVDAGRAESQHPSVTHPPESDSGRADPCGSSGIAS